jgi:hypothetical protein
MPVETEAMVQPHLSLVLLSLTQAAEGAAVIIAPVVLVAQAVVVLVDQVQLVLLELQILAAEAEVALDVLAAIEAVLLAAPA